MLSYSVAFIALAVVVSVRTEHHGRKYLDSKMISSNQHRLGQFEPVWRDAGNGDMQFDKESFLDLAGLSKRSKDHHHIVKGKLHHKRVGRKHRAEKIQKKYLKILHHKKSDNEPGHGEWGVKLGDEYAALHSKERDLDDEYHKETASVKSDHSSSPKVHKKIAKHSHIHRKKNDKAGGHSRRNNNGQFGSSNGRKFKSISVSKSYHDIPELNGYKLEKYSERDFEPDRSYNDNDISTLSPINIEDLTIGVQKINDFDLTVMDVPNLSNYPKYVHKTKLNNNGRRKKFGNNFSKISMSRVRNVTPIIIVNEIFNGTKRVQNSDKVPTLEKERRYSGRYETRAHEGPAVNNHLSGSTHRYVKSKHHGGAKSRQRRDQDDEADRSAKEVTLKEDQEPLVGRGGKENPLEANTNHEADWEMVEEASVQPTHQTKEENPTTVSPLSLTSMSCTLLSDCSSIEGSICGDSHCICPTGTPVYVDSVPGCFRVGNLTGPCIHSEQCHWEEPKHSFCNSDNICTCISGYQVKNHPGVGINCVSTQGRAGPVDPAMMGVLVGLGLMFVIICVVLRLFAKARFRETRSIFNTPNPRLMNASLLKDRRRGSVISTASGRTGTSAAAGSGRNVSPSVERRESPTKGEKDSSVIEPVVD